MLFYKKGWIYCFYIVFTLMFQRLNSQPPEIEIHKRGESPHFYFELITRISEDSGMSRLQVYIQLPYDELQFIKMDTLYEARYEISVTIMDENGNEVIGKILKKKIEVTEFQQTNSRSLFDTEMVDFNLKHNHYTIIVGIEDLDSKQTRHQKREIDLLDFREFSLQMSNIILADSIYLDTLGNIHPYPNVVGNYKENQDTIYIWFEIYSSGLLDSVRVKTVIRDLNGKVLNKRSYFKSLNKIRTPEVMKITREGFYSGKYLVEILLEGEEKISKTKQFSIRWLGMPVYTYDLDKAINQLRYIAKSKEIKKMKKANREEKMKLFKEFWNSKDPTPGTEENSVMEEYYRRVAICNSNFSTHEEGWKTDRGMVYILLGPPNEIERHPFEMSSKPYEVWLYYYVRKEFVFVDQSGFGDYRLITPYNEVYEVIR